MADKIFIKQLQTAALIGAFPEERKMPQTLLIDLEMSVDIQMAAKTDDLSKTIDYVLVYHAIVDYMTQCSFHLLETLADRLVSHLYQRFSPDAIFLCITKPACDIPNSSGAGVIIDRHFSKLT